MDSTLIICVAFVVTIPLVLLGLLVAARYISDRMVGDKHHLLEYVSETGQVPEDWKKGFQRQLDRARGDPTELARVEAQAREAYLQKLDGLVHYVRYTKLVDREATRQTLLTRLAEVRENWARSEEDL